MTACTPADLAVLPLSERAWRNHVPDMYLQALRRLSEAVEAAAAAAGDAARPQPPPGLGHAVPLPVGARGRGRGVGVGPLPVVQRELPVPGAR